jgi:hypothetical protein
MRRPEEFKKIVRDRRINFWPVRDCSICSHYIGYRFDGDLVFYDSGCGCTNLPDLQPRTWQELADFYNRYRNNNMDIFWGFDGK